MTDQEDKTVEKAQESVPDTEPETSEPAAAEPVAERETPSGPETPPPANHLAEKRGRMVAAGAVTAVILSAIAVLVAGVFHLTSRWITYCPKDLPVNDPAPILWKDLTADKEAASPLGVPESLTAQTGLKVAVPEPK